MASSQWPKNSDELGKYFWNKSGHEMNGNKIIHSINQAATSRDKVRLERFGPYIYGVIVNNPIVVIHIKDGSPVDMKLMKIGFTHADTSQTEDDNRITTVKTAAERKLRSMWELTSVDVSVIFVLPIDALDTRRFFDIESEVREKCGILLPKEVGKKLGLPGHTEWVVTTDTFVKIVRNRIIQMKDPNKIVLKRTQAVTVVDVSTSDGGSKKPNTPTSKPTTSRPTEQPSAVAATRTPDTDDLRDRFAASMNTATKTIDTKSVFNAFGFDITRSNLTAVRDFLDGNDNIAITLSDDGRKKLNLKSASKA